MMLFRSAQDADLTAIDDLAKHSGFGLTTLADDTPLLHKQIQRSQAAHQHAVEKPTHEYYLFVLEDTTHSKVVGTAAIEAQTGYETPLYSYKISQHTKICRDLQIRADYQILHLVNDYQGCSELCTLFLEPRYRQSHHGALLSKARFLFMANNPERFLPLVIAELRGVSDATGRSPFWDSLGYPFFHMSFAKADALSATTNKQFIADLIPRYPIYVTLLDKKAQKVIGQPHRLTVPAMKILLNEGFRYNHYVDIFDAGPTLEAPLSEIKTIVSSRLMVVQSVRHTLEAPEYLIANTQLDYRATISPVLIKEDDNTCVVNKQTATLLKVTPGDCIRLVLSD